MLKEFKTFISRGSVLDMAVGVLIGGAFNTLVASLTKNLLSPLIGLFANSINLSSITFKVGAATFTVGTFLDDVIQFLIMMFVIFMIVKIFNHMRDLNQTEEASETPIPAEEQYLKEIRDLLANQSHHDSDPINKQE
ncbi:large conductance mechanosensitive channel protein MscL [Lapidilactobacillus mulanensis]|uniref:Large-conductance mechanosensitive channel n=1 Tax=Lapidilactobacillus mulanensis TaxID=2485999 RepID=A0ABW4DRC0_9LACO|nr:large conductance mechanosensitive channel protein MscL [Lapidilactobacillus mulanensis]